MSTGRDLVTSPPVNLAFDLCLDGDPPNQALTTSRARRCSRTGNRSIKALSSSLVETVEQMPIRVQGHLDRGVAKASLDDLWVLALGNQKRSMGVPEIVSSERFTDRGADRRQPGSSPKVATKEWSTLRCCEHEPVRPRWPRRQMVVQLFGQESGQRHLTPSCPGLRESEPYLAAYLGERFGDGDGPSEQVEPVDPQPGKLTESTAGVAGGQDEGAVSLVDSSGEVAHLVRGEEPHLRLGLLRQVDPAAWGADDDVRIER